MSYTKFISSLFMYRAVIQLDGKSFCGDFVWDSFNKASRDEDNIVDQIYKSKYIRIIIIMISILYNIIKKMHTITTVAIKPNFFSFFLLCAEFL